MQNFENFTFDHLNNLQIGRIGEYWAKIWLTLGGFETYTVDVDDRGIDFVMKNQQNDFYKIQVKSIKRPTSSIFITKKGEWETDKLNKNLFVYYSLSLVIVRMKFYFDSCFFGYFFNYISFPLYRQAFFGLLSNLM